MDISEAMLDAGIQKAIEVGLVARHLTESEKAFNRAILRAVIEAVLKEPDGNPIHVSSPPLRSRDRWSFFSYK